MRPTRVRWLIFGLACAASWLLYLHRYAWGIVRPFFHADNPDLTAIELGWIDSAFLATYAIGQIPGGIAGDLFGPRGVLSVLALVWSLATLGIGWTTGFWRSFIARAAFGLAQAGVYPVISKMTRIWFPLATRTSVQGMVTAMGRVGGACAPVIIATCLMGLLGLSWRNALVVLTVPGIVLAVGFWLAVRNRPGEHPWVNNAEKTLIEDAPPTPRPPSPPTPLPEREGSNGAFRAGEPPIVPLPTPVPAPTLLLTRGSLFSMAMMFLYVFASTFQDQFYVNLLPSYLMRPGSSIDVATMGLFAPLPLLGGAVGGVIGGFLNDWLIRRTGERRWARSKIAFTGKMIGACMVLWSMQMEDGRVVMAVLVAARVFSDWSLPTQWAAVTEMGGRAAATVFGIVNTVGALGGFVAGPIFGWLKREYSWEGIFFGVAVMCIVAAVTWIGIDCTKKVVSD